MKASNVSTGRRSLKPPGFNQTCDRLLLHQGLLLFESREAIFLVKEKRGKVPDHRRLNPGSIDCRDGVKGSETRN